MFTEVSVSILIVNKVNFFVDICTVGIALQEMNYFYSLKEKHISLLMIKSILLSYYYWTSDKHLISWIYLTIKILKICV